MTRHPFNPGELGADDETLVTLADELERSSATSALPSAGFTESVVRAIDAEPTPRRPWYAALGLGAAAPAARGMVLGTVMAVAVALAIVVGGVLNDSRTTPGDQPSPSSSAIPTATATSSPTGEPTIQPTASPTIAPTMTPRTSPTVRPSASAASETPEGSASGTPEASDDHGGSGDGGGNSGPGGGSPSPS